MRKCAERDREIRGTFALAAFAGFMASGLRQKSRTDPPKLCGGKEETGVLAVSRLL